MTSYCSYDMNEHEECRNVTSHQFFFELGFKPVETIVETISGANPTCNL